MVAERNAQGFFPHSNSPKFQMRADVEENEACGMRLKGQLQRRSYDNEAASDTHRSSIEVIDETFLAA